MSTAVLENTNDAAEKDFLQQIRQYPRLTPEEELELAKRCAAGDEDAIRQMVNANLRLVVSVAREYAGRGVPLLDLVQEGSIGLLAAAKKFDYTRSYRFSTYATKWIRQGVTRCIVNHAGLIRVPQYTAEKIRKLIVAKAVLQQQSGQEPSVAELAAYTQMPEDKAAEYLSLIPEICSLDAFISEDGSVLALEDVHTPQPHEELIRRELKNTLDTMMASLTPRQQQVLRLHFGMTDGICYSLQQIGDTLEVSKERARQILQQAMDKLKKMGTDFGLEDFLS